MDGQRDVRWVETIALAVGVLPAGFPDPHHFRISGSSSGKDPFSEKQVSTGVDYRGFYSDQPNREFSKLFEDHTGQGKCDRVTRPVRRTGGGGWIPQRI